ARAGPQPAGQQDRLTSPLPLDAAQAFVILVPLPLIVTANAAVGKPWASHAIGILGGLAAGAAFLFAALDLALVNSGGSAGQVHNPATVDVAIMVTAVLAASLAAKPVRVRLARLL